MPWPNRLLRPVIALTVRRLSLFPMQGPTLSDFQNLSRMRRTFKQALPSYCWLLAAGGKFVNLQRRQPPRTSFTARRSRSRAEDQIGHG